MSGDHPVGRGAAQERRRESYKVRAVTLHVSMAKVDDGSWAVTGCSACERHGRLSANDVREIAERLANPPKDEEREQADAVGKHLGWHLEAESG